MTIGRLPSVEGGIQPTIVDAKGDLITATAADTPARLAVGTNGQYLSADSTASTGLAWASVSAGGMTLISTTTISNNATVSLTSIPQTYNSLYVVIKNYKPATAYVALRMRFNSDSGSNRHVSDLPNTSASYTNVAFNATSSKIANYNDTTTANGLITINIPDYTNTTTRKFGTVTAVTTSIPDTESEYFSGSAVYNQTTAISSLDFFSASGNLTSGTILLYGVK